MERKTGAWARMMVSLLEASGLSQKKFAERLGASPGAVQSRIAAKKGMPPLGADLDQWVKALRLEGEIAERFIRLAELEHTPRRLREEITETWENLERQTKRISNLEHEMAVKDRQLKELKSQLADCLANLPRK